jgi:YggT family protein
MFMISNFLFALAKLVDFVLAAYMWIIIGRAILSWVNPDPYNPIVRFLHEVTEPLLSRIRRVIPAFAGGIDFSPMILILADNLQRRRKKWRLHRRTLLIRNSG